MSAATLREQVAAERAALRAAYLAKPQPRALLKAHAQLIDRTVKAVPGLPADATLVATGGYGRGELYPFSDIDLLVLLAREPEAAEREALERLIGTLWDIGLEIGHSVRTVEGCVAAAADDVTVRTTLLEARYLCGSRALYRELERALAQALDPVAFFKAKKLEQEQRHAKHQDSPYSLEPNIKEAPGGLRDLQVIQWIARAAQTRTRMDEHAYQSEARQLHRIRVRVPDKPGVLARITQTLGAAAINIEDFELRHVSPEYGGVLVVLVAGAENAELARALLRRDGYAAA